MLVTLLGMDIEIKLLHLKNAFPLMLVTLFGMDIEVKAERSLNACGPMLVTSPSNLIVPCPFSG